MAAVTTPPELLSVLLWVGIDGIVAGYGGPYLVGNFWKETSKTAAIVAFLVAFGVYFLIHHGPQAGLFEGWYPFSENPFASFAVGLMVSCLLTYGISKFTEPMPEQHLNEVFRPERAARTDGGTPEPAAESRDTDG